jgi:hypothetical protein
LGVIAQVLKWRGRRLDRAYLLSKAKIIPVGASWERRDGSSAKPAPRFAKQPDDTISNLRVMAFAEDKKTRNARKRARRAA